MVLCESAATSCLAAIVLVHDRAVFELRHEACPYLTSKTDERLSVYRQDPWSQDPWFIYEDRAGDDAGFTECRNRI